MSAIPIELFRELILPYVPVEDLFRFRSVCKAWRRIIDDPVFVKKHINRGIGQEWFFHRHQKTGNIFLLLLKELITSQTYIKRINAKSLKNDLVGSNLPDFPLPCCNGLVLISSCDRKFVWRIWNPFTGESLAIKRYAFGKDNGIEGDDPTCGIGYDETNDDYKVVRVINEFTWIYSVNLEKWSKIEDFPDYISMGVSHKHGVFAYGALHWVTYSLEDEDEDEDVEDVSGWVVALDIPTQKYRKIQLPSEIVQLFTCCSLNAMGGCLFLGYNCFDGNFVMWMIKDYGGEDTWVKMGTVEVDQSTFVTPLTYLKSREEVLIYHYQFTDNKGYVGGYLWYDLEKKYSNILDIEVSTDGTDDEWAAGFQYIFSNFTSQVLPASLIRLKKSDCSEEGVTSQRRSKRKRKNAMVTERLPLKIIFGQLKYFERLDG